MPDGWSCYFFVEQLFADGVRSRRQATAILVEASTKAKSSFFDKNIPLTKYSGPSGEAETCCHEQRSTLNVILTSISLNISSSVADVEKQ